MANPTFTEDETGFRVFLSYAHADQELVQKIAEILKGYGIEPLWDKDIRPGTAFTEEIKQMIENSHLFIAVLTANSAERSWVQQEIGYALALKIPVLPLAIGKLPNEMIAYLQAVKVSEDLSDLAEKLQLKNLIVNIMPKIEKPAGAISITEWPETRTDLLIRYAQWVLAIGKNGFVRQQAWSSSLSIPDKPLDDPIWKAIDGTVPRSDYYRHLLLQERRLLELHIRQFGGKLIIDPTAEMGKRKVPARKRRLKVFSEFLDSIPDPEHFPLHFIISEAAWQANIHIVGNHFAAESIAWRASGYYQTIFYSHPTIVLEKIKEFDDQYNRLARQCGELNVQQAKEKIDEVIASLCDEEE